MSENTPEFENLEENLPQDAVVEESTTPAEDTTSVEEAAPAAEEATDADEAVVAAEDAADVVDPAEAAAEEFRAELAEQVGDWYVINSYAGYENRVKTNLENRAVSLDMEDYIFEIQVPMEDVVEIKNGQRKTVRRVRIPGYVLVRMDLTDESWGLVRNTPGVTGFVGNAYDPVPLTLDEVFSMLAPVVKERQAEATAAAAETDENVHVDQAGRQVKVEWEIGESVMVKEGSFEGHPATVQEINVTTQKITVLLSIFERDVPVELGFDQVSKI
ncbi:transcription termination/antitermination protein NusG [Brevibacterium litoralis]|uniref:transcription termination/antitermination protein NusG n=1 Tax=Brevibacterium litoralis TaxID=3138935 RepID=UPI0032EDBD18